MDKLRALRYFATSAKSGSFTRAAGQLGVTVPAVQKLVGQLERELGVRLLTRSPQGLALTAVGMRYLADVDHTLAELERADASIRPRTGDLAGLVVVAAPTYFIESFFEPGMQAFVSRYPEICVEFRAFQASADISRPGVDIYLRHGWYAPPDLVQRTLMTSNFVTLATPAFWDRVGRPQHPNDLRSIPCLTMRALNGTLMDLWDFERQGEVVRVPVKGPANFENSQADALKRMVRRGLGAFRSSHYMMREQIASGVLEPALSDWQGIGAPPVQLCFHSDARKRPAVSAVLDFITEQFPGVESSEPDRAQMPDWTKSKLPNASLQLQRGPRATAP